jgi:uncharacterized membrane protein YdjX (TVP38/TMEM64 family)
VQPRTDETHPVAISGATNRRRAALIKPILLFAVLFTVPLIWRWTPLGEWMNVETVLSWQESVKHYPGAGYLVVAGYLLGSLVLFPVVILNVATVFTFGPILGNVYALAGWLASAAMGYGIGRLVGSKITQGLARGWFDRLTRPVGRHGFLTVLMLRVFPVAPFTLVNIFVAVWGIRFWDFFWASLVGRIPGMILVALAGVQVERFLREPGMMAMVLLALTLILVPVVFGRLSRRLLPEDTNPSLKL